MSHLSAKLGSCEKSLNFIAEILKFSAYGDKLPKAISQKLRKYTGARLVAIYRNPDQSNKKLNPLPELAPPDLKSFTRTALFKKLIHLVRQSREVINIDENTYPSEYKALVNEGFGVSLLLPLRMGNEFIADILIIYYKKEKFYYTPESFEVILSILSLLFMDALLFQDLEKQVKKKATKLATSMKKGDSEDKFRKAFVTSPDSININRLKDGMYIDINRGFTRIMGYTREEILGHTSIEFNIWENPRERKKLVAGLLKNGEVNNFEARFLAKNNEVKYGLMSASIIEINGEKHILSVTRDTTKMREVEREIKSSRANLASLINGREESIWSVDTNYRYVIMNENFMNDYQLAYHHSLQPGEDALALLQGDLKKFWQTKYDRALSGKKVEFEFNEIVKNKKKHYLVIINPVKAGKVIGGASCISYDISERKELEKQLKENEKKYREKLENRITKKTKELTKANEKLMLKNQKLEEFNELFVDREFRIKELKEEIKKLKGKVDTL